MELISSFTEDKKGFSALFAKKATDAKEATAAEDC